MADEGEGECLINMGMYVTVNGVLFCFSNFLESS